MSPDFVDGDFVVVIRHPWQRWHCGEDVVVQHPSLGIIIKRISAVYPTGIRLTGLHPLSTSSETMGIQSPKAIMGKVLYHAHPRR